MRISKTSIIELLIKLVRKHWILTAIGLLFAGLASVFEVCSVSLVMPLLSILSGQNMLSNSQEPHIVQQLTSFISKIPQNWQLLVVALSFLLVTVIKNFSRYISNIQFHKLHLHAGMALRKKCIERFLSLDLLFHNQSKVGQTLTYVNEHVQRSEMLTEYALHIVRDLSTVFVLVIFLISLSPTLTLINICILTLIFFLLRLLIKYVRFHSSKAAEYIEKFSSITAEIISGIRVIKGFNSEAQELSRAEQSLQERHAAELAAYKYSTATAPLTETLGIAALLLILVVGSSTFANSGVVVPLLLTYTFALLRILPKVTQITSMRSQCSLLSGSLESIQQFLSSTEKLHLPDGVKIYQEMNYGISFENVTFTFPGNSEPTLKKVSFQIPKGKMTAIVGPSGSGKSTLLDLIMRFYDPNEGSIKVDGVELKELQVNSWRQAIGMVSQDTFLFNTSVKKNTAYGSPNATEMEIVESAKNAYAYEFIQKLPQGFDTILGNRGMKLSGGQRQRIAIARAILRKPDILILDEATSALDTTSERIVQKAIEQVSRGRTVIVIAHRLSTIEKADNIIVLRNGKVVEQGNHEELLAQQGEYRFLYKSQMFSQTQVA